MKNVKYSNTTKADLRDWCLLWGCPGVVILIISFLISLKVGDDFGQDNYVRLATFLIATTLQGMVYYLFMSVLADVPLKWRNRQQDEYRRVRSSQYPTYFLFVLFPNSATSDLFGSDVAGFFFSPYAKYRLNIILIPSFLLPTFSACPRPLLVLFSLLLIVCRNNLDKGCL